MAEQRSDRAAYEKLLAPAAVPVLAYLHHNLMYANQAAVTALRASSAEELLRLSPFEFVAPEHSSAMDRALKEALSTTGTTPLMVSCFRRFDGSSIDVEVAAWAVPYDGLRAVVVSFVDISERKKAEDEQRRTQARLELVLNNLPGLVSYIDINYRYQLANQRYSEWFGITDFVGKTMAEVLGESAFLRVKPELDRAFHGEHVAFERFLDYRSGGGRHVHINYVPDIREDGGVSGIVVLVEDFTDKKRAAEALEASEQRYRAFVQQSSEGIWRFELEQPLAIDRPVDEQIDWIYDHAFLAECNDATARMYGLERSEDLIGTRLLNVMPRSEKANEDYLRAFIESGYRLTNAQSDEVDVNGNKKYFLNSLVGIIENRTVVRAWGTQQDITEQKQLEDALIRANTDLKQFAYAAAHDLQEPVRTITLYTQLLERRYGIEFDEQGKEFLSTARTNAERMQALIQDLLAYTSLGDLGQVEAEAFTGTVESEPALQEAMRHLAPLIASTGAQIDCETLPPVPVRRGHLVQLFQNLLSNALKYRSDAPPVVRVSAAHDRSMWRFCVEDNGTGVPPAHHKRIFKLFARLHGRGIPGTGMGLAICQRIVEIYGGSIWVESGETSVGSRFCFTLPAAGTPPRDVMMEEES